MDDLLNQIRTLQEEINLTSRRIDEMSIWLFLATLACWSVTHPVMKIVSVFFVLFFFIEHVIRDNFSKKSYKARIKDIKATAESSSLKDEEKCQVIGALARYCENQLGFKRMFKTNYKYVVAAIFYAATLVLFLAEI